MSDLAGVLILGAIIWLLFARKPKRGSVGGGPMVMRSDNGYEGHLDFLEMHGAISAEDRQRERELMEDYKKNPQNYRTVTFEELGEILEKKKSSNQLEKP